MQIRTAFSNINTTNRQNQSKPAFKGNMMVFDQAIDLIKSRNPKLSGFYINTAIQELKFAYNLVTLKDKGTLCVERKKGALIDKIVLSHVDDKGKITEVNKPLDTGLFTKLGTKIGDVINGPLTHILTLLSDAKAEELMRKGTVNPYNHMENPFSKILSDINKFENFKKRPYKTTQQKADETAAELLKKSTINVDNHAENIYSRQLCRLRRQERQS